LAGRDIRILGRRLRMAVLVDEDWYEGPGTDDPERLLAELRTSGLKADLFTFAQKIPDCKPRFPYGFEWDDVAAIPVTSYREWWDGLTTDRRKDIKRAEKQGIVVKKVELDDQLVQGIVEINNDSRFRQGKRFKHYGKDFETVKREYATFPERSVFLAAYFRDELVGILKIVKVGELGCFLEVLSKTAYNDKRPMNALIARAVQLAEAEKRSYLTYGHFFYGNKTRSSFADFKQRNGFERIVFPRYFIPLTLKGRIAIRLRLHRGWLGILPGPLISMIVGLRSLVYRNAAGENAPEGRDGGAD
jgi:hypothetical protein